MNTHRQLAIIGPTASGKTSLALEVARQNGGVILSLDSLALYRHIDIASAKPTPQERGEIPHFGIDLIAPDTPFDVTRFHDEYRRAYAYAQEHDQMLIIVGGTGFYLKTLLEGISPLPTITDAVRSTVSEMMRDLPGAYDLLRRIDSAYAHTLQLTDRYRIEKALLIARASGQTPTDYFRDHPPRPIITDPLPIYEVRTERALLRERIALRTAKMLRDGLIDEVCRLERTYSRAPHPMKAIGIREVLDHLDGRYNYTQLREAIITHTAQLAKRQTTFNKSQFEKTIGGSLQELRSRLLR